MIRPFNCNIALKRNVQYINQKLMQYISLNIYHINRFLSTIYQMCDRIFLVSLTRGRYSDSWIFRLCATHEVFLTKGLKISRRPTWVIRNRITKIYCWVEPGCRPVRSTILKMANLMNRRGMSESLPEQIYMKCNCGVEKTKCTGWPSNSSDESPIEMKMTLGLSQRVDGRKIPVT